MQILRRDAAGRGWMEEGGGRKTDYGFNVQKRWGRGGGETIADLAAGVGGHAGEERLQI